MTRNKITFATAVFVSTTAAMPGQPANASPISLTNSTTTLTINGGEANNGLVPYGGFLEYTDIAQGDETTWSVDPMLVFSDGSTAVLSNGSAGGFGSPTLIGVGTIRSEASIDGRVSVRADTRLIGQNARTTFSFTDLSGAGLEGTRFVYYAENDIFSPGDDTALFLGSIGENNLELFQYESAQSDFFVRMAGDVRTGAELTSFGSGVWTGWGTALEAGDLSVLSADGSNFATSGDIGLALGFDLAGEQASLNVGYETVVAIPEPATLGLILPMLALAARRRRS